MKTTSVRDWRNHDQKLLIWIEAGEAILITTRGQALARLVPERGDPAKIVDWTS